MSDYAPITPRPEDVSFAEFQASLQREFYDMVKMLSIPARLLEDASPSYSSTRISGAPAVAMFENLQRSISHPIATLLR